jgi:hypothetical protein
MPTTAHPVAAHQAASYQGIERRAFPRGSIPIGEVHELPASALTPAELDGFFGAFADTVPAELAL